MKNLGYSILVLVFGLLSCSSQKKLQTMTPFEIGNATCQQWTGGRAESGTGTTLKIPVSQMDVNAIELKEVFFRGKKVSVILEEENDEKYAVANFSSKNDNSIEETNKLKLDPTEAVLSYLENGELKYTKVTGIKDKQPILYKGKPKN